MKAISQTDSVSLSSAKERIDEDYLFQPMLKGCFSTRPDPNACNGGNLEQGVRE